MVKAVDESNAKYPFNGQLRLKVLRIINESAQVNVNVIGKRDHIHFDAESFKLTSLYN